MRLPAGQVASTMLLPSALVAVYLIYLLTTLISCLLTTTLATVLLLHQSGYATWLHHLPRSRIIQQVSAIPRTGIICRVAACGRLK